MNLSHPYWTVLTVGTGLVTLSVLYFVFLLCGWARTKWQLAELQVQQLLADHHDTDG